jgi:hypothetical protein
MGRCCNAYCLALDHIVYFYFEIFRYLIDFCNYYYIHHTYHHHTSSSSHISSEVDQETDIAHAMMQILTPSEMKHQNPFPNHRPRINQLTCTCDTIEKSTRQFLWIALPSDSLQPRCIKYMYLKTIMINLINLINLRMDHQKTVLRKTRSPFHFSSILIQD